MKRAWLNFDPVKLDIRTLVQDLEAGGVEPVAKKVDWLDREGILEMANSADAVVSAMERWDRETLAGLENRKKLIIRYGTGIDNIDLAAATELGIPVANCAGANAAPVAEFALTHMLNCMRRLAWSASGPKEGVWPRLFQGNELDGKTVGLVGFGNIAKNLRRMLSGFDCRVLAFDAYARPDEKAYNVTAADSMEQIFRESDVISLHIPLNDETRKSINMKYFDMMKPSAYLVNTSRGGVIDEDDLAQALRAGKLRGAGLDVMAAEPPSMDSPLLHMDNVCVTTHMAASTYESEQRTQHMLAATIIAYLNGEVPRNILNKQVLDA